MSDMRDDVEALQRQVAEQRTKLEQSADLLAMAQKRADRAGAEVDATTGDYLVAKKARDEAEDKAAQLRKEAKAAGRAAKAAIVEQQQALKALADQEGEHAKKTRQETAPRSRPPTRRSPPARRPEKLVARTTPTKRAPAKKAPQKQATAGTTTASEDDHGERRPQERRPQGRRPRERRPRARRPRGRRPRGRRPRGRRPRGRRPREDAASANREDAREASDGQAHLTRERWPSAVVPRSPRAREGERARYRLLDRRGHRCRSGSVHGLPGRRDRRLPGRVGRRRRGHGPAVLRRGLAFVE